MGNYGSYTVKENGDVYNKHGKKMSPSDNGRGYLILSLTVGSKRVTKAVHRLLLRYTSLILTVYLM